MKRPRVPAPHKQASARLARGLVIAALLVSCSKALDADVSNPCDRELIIAFSNEDAPPSDLANYVFHSVGPRDTELMPEALAGSVWEGGWGMVSFLPEGSVSSFTIDASSTEPVPVAIPRSLCPQ